MTYKPGMTKTKKGPRGIAKVQLNQAKTKVRVTMVDEDEKKHIYELDADDCPTYVQSGEFKVSLNSDQTKMYGMYPANGMLKVKVNKFLSEEDKPPAPRTEDVPKRGDYNAYSYEYFTVLLEVVTEKYVGMIIPLRLRYHFTGNLEEIKGKDVEVTWYDKPGSKYTGMVIDFCEATGVWNSGPMKWKANILPVMQKRILSQGIAFPIVLKDGWVNTIFSDLEIEPDEEVLEQETEVVAVEEVADDFNDDEFEPNDETLDEEELDWDEE